MLRQVSSMKRFLPSRRFLSSTPAPKINPAILANIKAADRYKPGDRYNGFVCIQAQFIADFNMTAYMFQHEKTGLQYLHIDRQDSNNVFSINFRTTPFDSTGLPHILEHNVLCGSEKFPVRDPFFKMLNRSLATFMNAMTGPDYTLYPFSSTNEIDFRNLQTIYMDAAFRPNLKYLDFLQEGWRLEHAELTNPKSDYVFKGVVYNEMKGAFSENSAVFGQKFFNKILPDHTYGYVSGGDPLDIPQLRHEDLVNFHQKYYHPSNARIFSYGCFDLDKTMAFVDGQYLSDYDRIDSRYSVIPPQKRWTGAKKDHVRSRYDNMGAPIEKQNQIAIGYLMTDITDVYETFLMHILTELLVKGPNSFFYKNLIEPNISGGYNQLTGFDSHIRDTMFVVGLQDLAVDDFERVEQIFDRTVDEVIDKGFEQAHIESVLHSIELTMKHQTTKFGLGLLFNLTPLWNHDGDLIRAMNVSESVRKLREHMSANPKYLQNKVEYYFRNNRHRLTMTMSPDETYDKQLLDAERSNLQQKVANLNDSDKERIYREGIELSEAQKAPPNTDVLPCLRLDEIEKKVSETKVDQRLVSNVPTQLCPVNTNGIVYFRGILDVNRLNEEQKMLLPLFNTIITQFGTKGVNYREFDQLVSSKTAGIGFSTHLVENVHNTEQYEFGLYFGTYALDQNVPDMFDIFRRIFNELEMKDVTRFEMLLENYLSEMSIGIAQSGHMYAMQNANGLVTETGQLRERLMGIEHLSFMKNLTQSHKPEEILEKCRSITKLFAEAGMRCALNFTPSSEQQTVRHYESFVNSVPLRSSARVWNISHTLGEEASSNTTCRHTVMNIPVNYCAKSIHAVPYTHRDYAPLKVLAKYLSAKYLLPVVREQNGAYGAGAKITSDGLFNFFSYRDPNSRTTLDVFDGAHAWNVQSVVGLDEQTLFEAKLGVLQQLDVPIAPLERGMDLFRQGISDELFSKHRAAVLEVTKEQLLEVNERYLRPGAVAVVGKSVLGPENKTLSKDGESWKTFTL
ncbi:presequence protease, mitochondrial [Anopheles ziemanni]|uniref:presequence protease, mitochondrial n=1 Tax=Anopheles coustani TaxID=139045 RepID=UPI0026596BA3|nr:presequence protease, mitochondrial [Anopheles coustani]XP_058168619.1 presequence protease, mitochondrial [Anopheles ziemanni]